MSRVDIEFKNNLIEIKEKDDTKTNGKSDRKDILTNTEH